MTVPTPTPSTPGGRVRRSAIQVATGFLVSAIAIVNQDHLSVVKAGKYGGTTALFIILATILQNYAEKRGWLQPR